MRVNIIHYRKYISGQLMITRIS